MAVEIEKRHTDLQFDIADSQFSYSDEDVSRLIEIFSQVSCRGLFGNKQMDADAVENYLKWAKGGPGSSKYYLLLVRDINQRIVCGCDVQRTNEKSASIGFWKDETSRVPMKVVVETVLEWCKDCGFVEIDAYTEPTNVKAIRLLKKCGFLDGGLVDGRTKTLMKFSRLI